MNPLSQVEERVYALITKIDELSESLKVIGIDAQITHTIARKVIKTIKVGENKIHSIEDGGLHSMDLRLKITVPGERHTTNTI